MNSNSRRRAVQLLATVSAFQSSTAAPSINRFASTSLAFTAPHLSNTSKNLHHRRPVHSKTRTPVSSTITPTIQHDMKSQVKNRVALLQFHVTYDKSQNISTARDYITKAREAGARLCVLPECWNSPYATAAFGQYSEMLPGVGDEKDGEWGPSAKMLMEMAKSLDMYIVGGSVPEVCDGKLYNTCLVVNPDGKVIGKHRKVHLFDIDVPGGIRFIESETLSAGDRATYFDMDQDDTEFGLGRIGIGICYDIRFPEYALLLTQTHQCKILIYPGAFNLTTGPAHWELLQRARAVDGQCFVLTASPARLPPPKAEQKYPHYSAWGHSSCVSPWGDVLATCDENPNLVVVDLDMGKVTEMRTGIPTCSQKRHDLYKLVSGDGK